MTDPAERHTDEVQPIAGAPVVGRFRRGVRLAVLTIALASPLILTGCRLG